MWLGLIVLRAGDPQLVRGVSSARTSARPRRSPSVTTRAAIWLIAPGSQSGGIRIADVRALSPGSASGMEPSPSVTSRMTCAGQRRQASARNSKRGAAVAEAVGLAEEQRLVAGVGDLGAVVEQDPDDLAVRPPGPPGPRPAPRSAPGRTWRPSSSRTCRGRSPLWAGAAPCPAGPCAAGRPRPAPRPGGRADPARRSRLRCGRPGSACAARGRPVAPPDGVGCDRRARRRPVLASPAGVRPCWRPPRPGPR